MVLSSDENLLVGRRFFRRKPVPQFTKFVEFGGGVDAVKKYVSRHGTTGGFGEGRNGLELVIAAFEEGACHDAFGRDAMQGNVSVLRTG